MSKRRWGEAVFFTFVIFMTLGVFSSNTAAEMTTSFHGYFESDFVLRDANGIQYGFFDHAFGVQQRNTLKFDVDIKPDMSFGPINVQKVHLTYRGAYDSIFDLEAQRYHIQDNMGASRFDYGLKDIRFENDLREAFIDFAYEGALGSGFIRPGRQIVSWGEGLLETLNDVINPPDQSYNLFFQSPDDVKIPLWMGRLNYSAPRLPNLSLNFDLLWIPDIRPSQIGPRDSNSSNASIGLEAPYVHILPGFIDFKGVNIREKVPTNDKEYGAKVTASIGDRLSVSALYFRDVVNDPGVELTNFYSGATANFTHNKQHVYGGYFSYQLLAGNFEAVIRGEISHYTDFPINVASGHETHLGNWAAPGTLFPGSPWIPLDNNSTLQTFVLKPVTKTMLAIDKDMRIPWISPHDITKVSIEWLHKEINEWDGSSLGDPWHYDNPNEVPMTQTHRNSRVQDVFSLQLMTNWWASKLSPMLFVAVCPGKHGDGTTYMLHPTIQWNITPQLYAKLGLQAFMGDNTSSYDFAGLIPTSEATITMGYEW